MDLEILAESGWREALVAIVVLLVIYVLVVFLRIRGLKRSRDYSAEVAPHAARSAVAAYAALDPAVANEAPPVPFDRGGADAPPTQPAEPAFAWNEPPEDTPAQRRLAALESELEQLRREVGALRVEVLAVREERRSIVQEEQRRELLRPEEVVRNVMPQYDDAMQLAERGQDAAEISQLCGISRAEADLVVALARSREQGDGPAG